MFVSTGWYYTICPTHPVEAEEGDDVTLQGRLDPSINLVNYTVDFKRTDLNKVVHCYRHGKDDHDPQMEQYRFRTTLSHEDLSRGVLTLQISSVRLSDSGPYKAFVPKLMASCIISLSVGKHSDLNASANLGPTSCYPVTQTVRISESPSLFKPVPRASSTSLVSLEPRHDP